jgi:hypothetical protein
MSRRDCCEVQFELQVRDVHIQPAVPVHIRGVDSHARFIAAILTCGHPGNEGNIFERTIMLVEKEEIRPRVVGDGDVRPAVIVEIREHHTHTLRFRLADTRPIAHIRERSVMIVVIQLGLLPFVIPGMTVGAVTRPVFSAPDVVLRAPVNVVRNDQVQVAVLVIVEPARAG